ncbi:hypothetical protein CMI42_05125 [Candidatus Pacearchaeota archaeon]|nr:hypothetical protein [Candidatus Pacearchaeota archaeon]|tara:strand:+ start:289 stop:1479 length:1191 start_codon:yes stop_codon:yes gene_type:complete
MKNFEIFKNKKLFDKPIRFRGKRIEYKDNFVKVGKHFSGNSPPEIFVGRYNYPNVNAGVLSPNSFEGSEEMSMPELWHAKKFSIGKILERRNKLIYGRFKASVKKNSGKFLDVMKEVSMAYKPVSTEFFLKNNVKRKLEINRHSPLISNLAPLENLRLQENPKIKKKVDYLVGDVHSKSVDTIKELYSSNISVSNVIKILSAGLLGLESKRKLVPTRWSITAVDDTLSKEMLKKIRYYPEIGDIELFHAEYNGNHYEILLIPRFWSFEVIEAEIKLNEVKFWQDHESFHGRKNYASNVTGGYYAVKLAACEYLDRVKRQASVLILREVTPRYYAPLGVGILRECCRGAFLEKSEKFDNLSDAFERIQERINLNVDVFKERSELLKELGQRRLMEWF